VGSCCGCVDGANRANSSRGCVFGLDSCESDQGFDDEAQGCHVDPSGSGFLAFHDSDLDCLFCDPGCDLDLENNHLSDSLY
jgi:hypothetical protein